MATDFEMSACTLINGTDEEDEDHLFGSRDSDFKNGSAADDAMQADAGSNLMRGGSGDGWVMGGAALPSRIGRTGPGRAGPPAECQTAARDEAQVMIATRKRTLADDLLGPAPSGLDLALREDRGTRPERGRESAAQPRPFGPPCQASRDCRPLTLRIGIEDSSEATPGTLVSLPVRKRSNSCGSATAMRRR